MIFTATLAYQGDNPKFNIFHGSKVYDGQQYTSLRDHDRLY